MSVTRCLLEMLVRDKIHPLEHSFEEGFMWSSSVYFPFHVDGNKLIVSYRMSNQLYFSLYCRIDHWYSLAIFVQFCAIRSINLISIILHIIQLHFHCLNSIYFTHFYHLCFTTV